MSTERIQLGREIETALVEVLTHVRGETEFPVRMEDLSAEEQIQDLNDQINQKSE